MRISSQSLSTPKAAWENMLTTESLPRRDSLQSHIHTCGYVCGFACKCHNPAQNGILTVHRTLIHVDILAQPATLAARLTAPDRRGCPCGSPVLGAIPIRSGHWENPVTPTSANLLTITRSVVYYL